MPELKDYPKELEVVWDGRELDWVSTDQRLYLRGVGIKYLINPYFEEGFKKLIEEYRPPKERYELALILPCAYGKPYSQSYIHYIIRSVIKKYLLKGLIHEVIVTNAGVVPRDLDEYWPYCAYDWNPQYETPEIKKYYIEVLKERLLKYLETHGWRYKKIAAYLRWDSDSWKAVQYVSNKLKIQITNLAAKKEEVPETELMKVSLDGLYQDEDLILITPTSLKKLRDGIDKIIKNK